MTITKTQNDKVQMTESDLRITNLRPTPRETWEMMVRFSGPTEAELNAMRQTVDVLFQNGYDLVVAAYDHLQHVPETAEVLGWENGVDEKHLAERRRFFTIWLARTLSIDLGTDFAGYLFHAGHVHAGHGPRHIHTPAMWVTGSMGLVLAGFAQFIQQAHSDAALVAAALAGWNKYLMIQLNQMMAGYEVALALDDGPLTLPVKVFGTARLKWGRKSAAVHYHPGDQVADVLRKLMNYAPVLREIMFAQDWEEDIKQDSLWSTVTPTYLLRDNWRVLLNGQDLRYNGGFRQPLHEGDTLELFPPGR